MAILPSAMNRNDFAFADGGIVGSKKHGRERGGRRGERTAVRLQDVLEFACARHKGQEEG